MSALADAKRFLWLYGVAIVDDDPVELLRAMVAHVDKIGFNAQLLSENNQLKRRVVELETELKETRKKLMANIEHLQAQLTADHQHRRIQTLETQLKEERGKTAAFRRALVQGKSVDSKP